MDDRCFQFNVFRKSSFAGRHIDGLSNHSILQKMSFIYSSIYRIFHYRLNEVNRIKELQYLRDSCVRNNINPNVVTRIFKRVALQIRRTNSNLQNITLEEKFLPGWLTLEHTRFNRFLSRALRKNGIRTTFRTSNTTRNYIPLVKSEIPKLKKSGVYTAVCGVCKMKYVGQTVRNFEIRYNEHRKYPDKSSVCDHCFQLNHDPA